MHNQFQIGIDLGGTKIEIAALNNQGEFVYRKRSPTPKNDYKKTIQTIASLLNELEQKIGIQKSLGIGIPGSISPFSGVVRNGNSTWLNGKNLNKDLSELINKKIFIENDANCFAISESIDGAGANYKSVFGVIMGTGVGAGLVINKKIIKGFNGIAGEWGHNSLPWMNKNEIRKRNCWCKLNNCIETFISGPSVEKEYSKLNNESFSLKEIVKRDKKNNMPSKIVIDNLVNRTSRCLALIINIYDPEIIVLGGGLSNIDRLYEEVPKLWGRWIFSDKIKTKIKKAKFGDSSGVRGSAWLNSNIANSWN